MSLGKLTKLVLIPIIAGSLFGCIKESKIPNLGVVEVPFEKGGKWIKGQCLDVDNDRKVDGVLGDGYLLMYKEGYEIHPDFKEHYDPARSLPMDKKDVEVLSKRLKKNNYREYQSSLIQDYVEQGGI